MTGIPRVVRNLARHGPEAGRALGVPVIAVAFSSGVWRRVDSARLRAAPMPVRRWATVGRERARRVRHWVKRRLGLMPPAGTSASPAGAPAARTEGEAARPERRRGPMSRWWRRVRHRVEAGLCQGLCERLEVGRGDLLVLPECLATVDIEGAVVRARADGARVAVVMYDLIPVLHPETTSPDTPGRFAGLLRITREHADVVASISRATRDAFAGWLAEEKEGGRPAAWPALTWFHLGADLEGRGPQRGGREGRARPTVAGGISRAGHAGMILMVGTIEPRKGHGLMLDACERLWRADPEGAGPVLCVIGSVGWRVEALHARLLEHAEHGRRLLVINDASDAELERAYAAARLVVMPSRAEGFGLPVVEALARGIPVLASDLAVHREIGGDRCTYLPSGDAAAWAGAIDAHLRGPARRVEGFAWPDWAASTRHMIAGLLGVRPEQGDPHAPEPRRVVAPA